MATQYESRMVSWESLTAEGDAILDGSYYPCFEPRYVNMLLAWHAANPVSQEEIDRNNEIYTSCQHNRNPFIVHPEWAIAVWNPRALAVPEPSNFPENFTARNIHLQWIDAGGSVLTEGYLVRMSVDGFDAITVPVDGVPVVNSEMDKNVMYGIQEAWFTGLIPNTTYYFMMYGYSGTGSGINYKTDGGIPQVMMSTSP